MVKRKKTISTCIYIPYLFAMALGSESNVKLFNLILILDSMGSLRPIYKRVQPLLPGTVWFLCFCLFATCEWRPVIHVPWLSPVVGRQYTHVQVNPPPPTKEGGGAEYPSIDLSRVSAFYSRHDRKFGH